MRHSLGELLKEACAAAQIFLNKAISRKFIVWVVATHMTYIELLDPNSWLTVSLIYTGVQTVLDWKNHDTETTQQATTTLPELPTSESLPAN